MIVPRYRLLSGWRRRAAVCAAGALAPEAAPICILFVGVLAGPRLPMPYLLRESLAGIGIELPPVTRMSKDREGRLEVRIRNEPPTGDLCALLWVCRGKFLQTRKS